MHDFQPYPIESLEFDPFTQFRNKWGAITAGADGKVNTMTASWGCVGELWGKDVGLIFVRDSRYTKEFIDKSDTFSISFFDDRYHAALKYLGQVSGRDEDKIQSARLHVNYIEDIPFIDEGNFIILCRKIAAVKLTEETFLSKEILPTWYADGDFHTMYVGEIIQVLAR